MARSLPTHLLWHFPLSLPHLPSLPSCFPGIVQQQQKKEFALSFELRFYFLETVGRGSLPSSWIPGSVPVGKLFTFSEWCFLIYKTGLIILTLSTARLLLGLIEIMFVKIFYACSKQKTKNITMFSTTFKVFFPSFVCFSLEILPICAFCSNVRILNYVDNKITAFFSRGKLINRGLGWIKGK